jgi:hypothetical protein
MMNRIQGFSVAILGLPMLVHADVGVPANMILCSTE